MTNLPWPALITLLDVVLLVWVAIRVGAARTRLGVPAPATTGNPEFERIFRVQMNTIENSVVFLPTVWIAAGFGAGAVVGALGLAWIVGRVLYAIAYTQAAAKRSVGFAVSYLAFLILLVYALVGVGRAVYNAL